MDYYNLGTHSRKITTGSAEAQLWFDRGLLWTYGYHHEEAIFCFEQAPVHDPDCAMAHWGIAYATGPNYNKPWEAFEPDEKHTAIALARKSLEELLGQADIVILALPLNKQTLHTMNTARLALMQPGAFLINPCRGSVVQEAAVLEALESGQLGGYAADVFEMEDWAREDRPQEICPTLRAHPNTLFTAHIGSAVQDVRLMIEQRAADNILQALQGECPQDAANSPTITETTPC